MFDYNKNLIANIFLQLGNKNIKYIILIAIDTYSIEIDNSEIKLVIKKNFLTNFDAII